MQAHIHHAHTHTRKFGNNINNNAIHNASRCFFPPNNTLSLSLHRLNRTKLKKEDKHVENTTR